MDKRKLLWRLLLMLAVVALVVLVYRRSGLWESPERLRELGAGWRAAAVIVLTMTCAWGFALPASAFLLITPLLFPTHVSVAITTAGCALGSALGYFVARFVGGWWVERFRDGRLRKFLTRHSGFFVIAGLRLAPGSPHGIVNYAAGLAAVPFARFVAATTLAMAVKSYVYATAVSGTVGAKSLAAALSTRTLLALLGLALLALAGHLLSRHFSRAAATRGEGVGC